jgi:hypothetical protein
VDGIIGQTDDVRIEGGQVLVTGIVMGVSDEAARVVALADAGFAWQASVGVEIIAKRFIPAGKTAQVNGQVVQGEAIVITRGQLREISIVSLGADDKTSTIVATGNTKGKMEMDPNFQKWIEEKGLVPDELDEAKIAELQKEYAAEQAADPPAA